MTTVTHTHYEIGLKDDGGGSFSPDGRKTSWSKTYDLPDCEKHIAELREHIYNGKKIYKDSQFVIRTVTVVTTETDFLSS